MGKSNWGTETRGPSIQPGCFLEHLDLNKNGLTRKLYFLKK